LLWETVSEALNSKRILDQSSPWSNKQDQVIISPKITLSQDPTLSPHNCPFDDEGTPTQKLSLITLGHLKTVYSDRKRARQLGLNSTGNGFRAGLGTYPSPSLVNLIVEAGDGDLSQFIQQIDTGLLIDQVLGERADISGDISVNIDLGYRIEKGKVIGRVKDTMVSGNIYTALQEIQQIGADRRWNGSCYTPSLQVGGLTVVGGGY
jgi:PmbA protein